MWVLVVEDEPFSALSAVLELEQAGHQVVGPAATLDHALQLARGHRPELALIDIDLQHTGEGLSLARRFRSMDIPSVFVSGEIALANANSALALGFIGKPYDPADLSRSVDIIEELLQGHVPTQPIPRSLHLFS